MFPVAEMKNLTRLIHLVSLKLNLDDIAAIICPWIPIARKLIPEPWEYPKGTIKRVVRKKITLDLDVSDYMQWFEYAQLPDLSTSYLGNLLVPGSNSKIIIDIGANIGSFTIRLAHILKEAGATYQILSVEPNPEIYKQLVHNLSLNTSISDHVYCLERASGDSNISVEFDLSTSNSGNSKVIIRKEHMTNESSMIVPQITIDSLCQDLKLQSIECIKIDVEGYEPFVIDGAMQSIARFNPILYIEITPKWFTERGRTWNDLFMFLTSREYKIYYDHGQKLEEMLSSCSVEKFQYNVLALPRKYSTEKIIEYIK